jgi:GTP-binding protein Era
MDSVDVVIMCIPADETSGAGDTYIAQEIAKHPRAKKFAVITKTDLISKEKLALRLLGIMKIAKGFTWDEIIPVSAAIHDQVDLLNELIGQNLPQGPQYYPEGTTSDQAIEQLICEFIREAALQDVREELPHSIVVTIDEFGEREEKGSRPFYDVHATIHVERDTQRAILLGHQGARLKEIGIRARVDIERALAAKIFLGLHIKVSKEWQKDPKLLERLGFGDKG